MAAGGVGMRCACAALLVSVGLPADPAAATRRPDLVVTAASGVTSSLAPGAAFTIADTVRNVGRRRARASTTGYLLSLEAVRTADDTLLGTRVVKRLKPKKSAKGTAPIRLPLGTPTGRYVILACADVKRKVKESREKNNCRPAGRLSVSVPLTVVPVPTPAPTPSATPGQAPDSTPPVAPQITGATPPSPSADDSPDLIGQAEPNATVRLYIGADCSGSVVRAAAAGADGTFGFLAVAVSANATTSLHATATDAGNNVSACSPTFSYVHDSLAPAPPSLTSTTPTSPGKSTSPDVSGTVEPRAEVRLFKTSDCSGTPLASLTAPPGGPFTFPSVSVAAADTTQFRATATDAAGNTTACSAGLAYTQDSVAPAAPSITRLSPVSGSSSISPSAIGTAESGSVVHLFATNCAGTEIATGSASEFAAAGISFPVASQSTTSVLASATDAAGNESPCSVAAVYRQCSILCEDEPNDTFVTANPIGASDEVVGALQPAGDIDIFSFTLTAPARISIDTFDASESACVDIDPAVALHGPDPSSTLAVDDDSGLGLCAKFSDVLVTQPGTYHLVVNSNTPNATIADYRLHVTRTPTAAITQANPAEGSVTPNIIGGAPAGTTVSIFATSDCSGSPLGSGSQAQFTGSGISVTVPPGTQTPLYVKATSPATTCEGPFNYESAPSVAESEANNTAATANTIPAPSSVTASIQPAGDVDFFSFTLPSSAAVVLETFDSTGVTCTPASQQVSTVLSVFAADGTTQIVPDTAQGGQGGCSKITRTFGAGTYYVKARVGSGSATTFDYRLRLRRTLLALITSSVPTSPNASTAPSLTGSAPSGSTVSLYTTSDCSGAAAATGTAGSFASPGLPVSVISGATTEFYAKAVLSGSPDTPCTGPFSYQALNPSNETEPNDTTGQADAAAAAITADARVVGSISAASDVDLYKVTVASPTTVRIELFDSSAADCTAIAPQLALLDATASVLYDDIDASGIGNCGALVRNLPAGTYYARVKGSFSVATYVLEFDFQNDNGSETEANDTVGTASPFGAAGGFRTGDHNVGSDIDFYAVTLTRTASIRAETLEAPGGETCESQGVDTELRLLRRDGSTVAATDNDDGRGFCSLIDGTGATPRDSGAASLPAGTYYLRAAAPSGASPTGAQFIYRLQVTVR